LLLDNRSIAEAAILLRSQINLVWCFLFMVEARTVDKRFEFESEPHPDSNCHRRAARYLSWHWIDLYRSKPTPRTKQQFDQVIRELGYASEKEVPTYWYQEGKIRNIKDLAQSAGALPQYEEDYGHLSGIEHGDITAVMVERMDGERYGDFVAFKATQCLATVMDFVSTMCACDNGEALKALLVELNTLADDIEREQAARYGA
jgi:hypothetical protein